MQNRLTFYGGRFVFQCDYTKKHIPKNADFKWDKNAKVWNTGETTVAAKLKSYADKEAKQEFEKRREKYRLSSETKLSKEIDIPCPDGLEYFDFQKVAIKFGLLEKNILIADEMGVGKTISALGIINSIPDTERVLIICPAFLTLNWKSEAEKWLVKKYKIHIISKEDTPDDANVLIAGYEMATKHIDTLSEKKFDTLICDESHYLKNEKSKRTKAILKGNLESDRKIFLSGTPMLNRPIEMFAPLNALQPKVFSEFFPYALKYCNAHQGMWGWDFKGASNEKEFKINTASTCVIRREKKDVLPQLPSKTRKIIEIKPDEVETLLQTEHQTYNLHKEAKNNKEKNKLFGELAKMRRELGLAKVPTAVKHVKNIVENGSKVVVFSHHHEVLDELSNALKNIAVVADGRHSVDDRNINVNRFEKDDTIRVFIGGIKAVGVGITLTAASHVVFAELDWTPGTLEQAEDRCHRIGQKENVLIEYLVFQNSLDKLLLSSLRKKQKVIKKMV